MSRLFAWGLVALLAACEGEQGPGTEALVIDQRTGEPRRVPSGNIGFGIRVDEAWDFIEWVDSALAKPIAGVQGVHLNALAQSSYPQPQYRPFPPGWGR